MSGFMYKGSLADAGDQQLRSYIIDNSDVVTVGDAMTINTDGHATLAAATNKILGIAVGVVDKNGIKLEPDAGTVDTYTMASDNETVNQYKVLVDTSKNSLWENTGSAVVALTNLMQFFDLTDEDTINVGSASDTTGSFQLEKLVDGDTSKGIFRIAESKMDPYAQA